MASAGIRRPADMFSVATGRSSDANERRVAKIMEVVAIQNVMNDLSEVTSKSSDLVLTILFNNVKIDSTDGSRILGKDSMSALIQVLQLVYEKASHESQWSVLPNRAAAGNPTRGNIHLSHLRRAHMLGLRLVEKRRLPPSSQHHDSEVCQGLYRLEVQVVWLLRGATGG
jgi:hypothetical protein